VRSAERKEPVTIRVRIVQLGKGIFEFGAEPGTTVAAGLARAGIDATRMEVRVRGRRTELDVPLEDGDLVTVIPRIKGGRRPIPTAGGKR
jgi:molybdopterin converting factor small subunit